MHSAMAQRMALNALSPALGSLPTSAAEGKLNGHQMRVSGRASDYRWAAPRFLQVATEGHPSVSHQTARMAPQAILGNGLFTQTKPEVRRVVPKPQSGTVVVKIVYVVLEAQYQSSLTQAVRSINKNRKDVNIEVVGYLVEELRDPENYAMFKHDLSTANIFIGSLIFVEELAVKVREAVEVERERMDAVLVFPSMPEVMRLNKLGTFSMSQLGQSRSAIAEFMKKKRKESGSGFEESMLKLIRTLPKVLKYLPSDKAQDARNFMMSLQFWLGGSPETSKTS